MRRGGPHRRLGSYAEETVELEGPTGKNRLVARFGTAPVAILEHWATLASPAVGRFGATLCVTGHLRSFS